MPGPTYRAHPVGRYQTRTQRIERLNSLADAERQRLQTRFRQQANLTAQDLGRAQGLHDRFQPPKRFEFPAIPTAISEIPTYRQKATLGTGLTPEETARAYKAGLPIRSDPAGGPPRIGEALTPSGQRDIGSPHGEPPFPGLVGKIPGLRTPAELAATLGTAGLGSAPVASKVGALIAGSGGAYGGRQAAPVIGVSPGVGELVGGLGGGLAGAVAGPRVTRVTGQAVGEAVERARLQPELGGGRLPGELPSEGGAVPPGRPPVEPPGAQPPEPPEGFAANIRLSKYPEETRAAIQEWADANPEAVQAARRGVRPDAQVMEDARSLVEEQGGNFSKLQRRWKPGEAWNAEEIVAIRGTLRSKTEAVLEAANAARAVDSTENHARLLLAMREQAQAQQVVHGITAETGRALRSFRQEAFDAIASNDTQKLQELMRRTGLDKGKLDAFADRIAGLDLNNPVEVNNFLRSVDKPKFGDYVMEFWINSILSGPKTHVINALSNTAFGALSVVERGLAAAVDVPLARLQGRQVGRFFQEVPASAFGALSGIDEGVRAALRTLRDGINPEQASKWEFRRTAFAGGAGRVIRLPGTALEAADSLFYSINYRAELNSLIVRQARSEGLRGSKLIERIADLKLNPTEKLIRQAAAAAEYRLFRHDPGKILKGFMSLRESVPGGRFILPFLRTPGNLLAAGLERSPFGLLNPSLWRNIAAKSPEASDQISRLLLGSGVAAGLGAMVAKDRKS